MSEVTKIIVNGREYDSIEQMPPDVLREYLQAMEALGEGKMSNASTGTIVSESITYNGHEYKSRDELPPAVRALLAQMPEPSADEKTADVEIKTVRTFRPQLSVTEKFDEERCAPEEDPVIAWLLVKILSVVIVILFILLGLKHIGW